MPANEVQSTSADQLPTQDSDASETGGIAPEGIAALLALLGLTGAGFALSRSRRRAKRVEAAPRIVPYKPATPDARGAVLPTPPQAKALSPEADARFGLDASVTASSAAFSTAPRPAAPVSTPAAREMPQLDGPVPSGEARTRLMEQMVAAEPDSANPFRSQKARRRRARIILETRAYQQREAEENGFDWRTYKPSKLPQVGPKPTLETL